MQSNNALAANIGPTSIPNNEVQVSQPIYPTPNGSALPTPTGSSPSNTTVATSGMAQSNFNTQQQGFNQLDQSVTTHSANRGSMVPNPNVSIVDLLSSKGQPTDFGSRARLAASLGIANYTGSAAQNGQLITLLGNNAGQTQTTTTQTEGEPATTTTTGPTPDTPTPTTYESTLSDIDKSQQEAFDQYNKDLESIRNGTFPLSTYEQAQLDATQKAFDEVRAMQLEANKGYEALQRQAQFRTGRNITDPGQFLATNQKIISDDIRKISSLDATAAKTMNELRQSFLDKDYKLINDKYTSLNSLLKDKSATISAVQDRADRMATDLRDYNLKVKSFELDREKTYAEIAKIKNDVQKSGHPSLGTGEFSNNVKTALAGIKFSSVADRKVGEQAIADLLAQGDMQGARDQLQTYAFNGMSTDEQQKVAGRQDAIKALENIETKLQEFQKAGGNTGIFTGVKQKNLEKVGLSAGALSGIANDIALAIIDYRKAVSGSAFTESEASQYEKIFPSTGKTPELNAIKIKSLKDKFSTDLESSFARRVPKYKEITNSLNMVRDNPLNLDLPTSSSNNNPLNI